MAKCCIVTGKKTTVGNNVSHSNIKTKRKLFPNLQKKRLKNPATGRTVTVTISTRGLRTLHKWDREGKVYDLTALK
ncbi:50S ribosomal protein L28 [Candidatus Uhrbacteria bacterium]|nr:50S ribosomal protein L28 [Candidatus Uhrbacteria bacterium]